MSIPFMRKAAIFFFIFMVSPIVAAYLSGIGWTGIWIWGWLLVWTIFVNIKWDDATKGIFLIAASSWIAIIGKHSLPEKAPVIEAIENVMILVAGGVGGNFIYAYLAKQKESSPQPGSTDKQYGKGKAKTAKR